MKRFILLVSSCLALFSGCGQTSYFETVDGTGIEESGDVTQTDAQIEAATIFVQVAGAVEKPGVYELDADSRVFQAIDAAGGLADYADDSDLELAALLSDGEKIYVYSEGEKQELALLEAVEHENEVDDGLININTASLDELLTLPGIGQAKANQIISYRSTNGNFNSIDEIKNVSGIGDGIFNQIQAYIKV